MKKIILLIAITLTTNCFSQTDLTNQIKSDTSYQIVKFTDDMTDKVYYSANKKLIISNDDKTKGVSINLNIDDKTDKKLSASGLMVKMINIGSCCENNEVIILFEDSTKITIKSWNKFNCDGNAWFSLNTDEVKLLSSKRILKIRVYNGRTHDSFTKEVPTNKQDYFIQCLMAISENRIIIKK
jgi:hypothetical protein